LEERVAKFFDIDQLDPFMTMAQRVRPQTVSRRTNPRLYAVIESFAALTGIPVILNTSFNNHEPIGQKPEEAIACYLRTKMCVVLAGNFYSSRERLLLPAKRLAELQAAE
jgi:carbamoyltransferase